MSLRQLFTALGLAVAAFGGSCSDRNPQDASGAPPSDSGVAPTRQAPAPATLKSVSLQVRSKSWIDGVTFDQEALRKLCSAEQVQLVEGGAPDGVLTIDYLESKGSGYSMFGVGSGSDFGTDITYKATLLKPDGTVALKWEARATTPSSGVHASQLHDAAVARLKAMPQYHALCAATASVLGVAGHAERLFTWAAHDAEGLKILESTGVLPASDREHAFVAVARRRLPDVASLGSRAADPLVFYLRSFYEDAGYGQFDITYLKQQSDFFAGAVDLLAKTGDPRTVDVLESLLRESARWRRDMVKPVVVPTLKALGDVGSAVSIQAVEAWLRCETCDTDQAQERAVREIALVATEAANRIKARAVGNQLNGRDGR